jgi:hypothetical protein
MKNDKQSENRRIKEKIKSLKEELTRLNNEIIEPVSEGSFRPTFSYSMHVNCTQDMFRPPPQKKPSCPTCEELLFHGFSTASCKNHQKSKP